MEYVDGGESIASGVTVTGCGRAMADVDTVTVSLAVQVLRADAGEAFRDAETAVTSTLRILADHGVDARSVRTLNLSLGPHVEAAGNGQTVTGYQAAQQLSISLEGLASVGAILSDATVRLGGALQIRGVSLTAAHPRDAHADARAAAMVDAREKATTLAALANRPLGRVVAVVEQPSAGPTGVALLAQSPRAAASMPIVGGDESVTATVRVHFAWGD